MTRLSASGSGTQSGTYAIKTIALPPYDWLARGESEGGGKGVRRLSSTGPHLTLLRANRSLANSPVRRLGRAGGHSQRRLAQDSEGLGGSDAADAMRLQDFGETGLVDLGGPGGSGRAFPQRQEVFRHRVVGQLQHLRVIAPQQLADPVGQAGALLAQVVGDSRPLAQFDDRGIIRQTAGESLEEK